MASRTAKVASSIVAGILAGAPLFMPRDAANAAECLTEPGKDAAQGQHWYYRIEHGTKRHCWYTREGGGKVSQAAPSDDSPQAPQAAGQKSENPPRSVEDARAEYPMPQAGGNTVTAPAPGPAPLANSPLPNPPQADTQGSAVAARWPSPDTAAAPPATASPAAPPAAADATDAAPATDAAADASADTPAPAPTAAILAPAKPSVSLQMLLVVIGGALTLAGLTASVVYRLGRRKQRRLATRERRAVLWKSVETGPKPPWVEEAVIEETVVEAPVVEEKASPPAPGRRAAQGVASQQRYAKIEEILAQLVKQAQESDA